MAAAVFLSIKEFNNVAREDLLQFYHKNFTPKNTVLMVVGRVDKVEFKKKIIDLFGSVARRSGGP